MATEGQNFNGYLWKMTDKYGHEGYLVTETPNMNGNVLATNVEKFVYGGEEHYSYYSLNAVTLEDVSAATTTKIARVDYNKRKFGPVTVKNYSLDYVTESEYAYESTLQSIEEYDTQSVSLYELISVSRTAIVSIPYGATVFIIDGDVLVDGKTYRRDGDFLIDELENYDYGSVYLAETGEIIGFDQDELTGYDMTNEMFDPNAGRKVISIISVATVG
jgi:hypothetical protein